jgi:putative transposase
VRVLPPTRWAGRLDEDMASRKRHTPEQVVRKLAQADRLLGEGKDVADVCRELQVFEQTY